jgi:hypothetical protein
MRSYLVSSAAVGATEVATEIPNNEHIFFSLQQALSMGISSGGAWEELAFDALSNDACSSEAVASKAGADGSCSLFSKGAADNCSEAGSSWAAPPGLNSGCSTWSMFEAKFNLFNFYAERKITKGQHLGCPSMSEEKLVQLMQQQ